MKTPKEPSRSLFQSTPPARGATEKIDCPYSGLIISIHAPREGGDITRETKEEAIAISIHAPREGGDRPPHQAGAGGRGFQSTPPARGATRMPRRMQQTGDIISIHAPREGGDLSRPEFSASCSIFQSTPPARGATIPTSGNDWLQIFQSTPPARGATHTLSTKILTLLVFQSTPPARGATIAPPFLVQQQNISIHAPREGGDRKI